MIQILHEKLLLFGLESKYCYTNDNNCSDAKCDKHGFSAVYRGDGADQESLKYCEYPKQNHVQRIWTCDTLTAGKHYHYDHCARQQYIQKPHVFMEKLFNCLDKYDGCHLNESFTNNNPQKSQNQISTTYNCCCHKHLKRNYAVGLTNETMSDICFGKWAESVGVAGWLHLVIQMFQISLFWFDLKIK